MTCRMGRDKKHGQMTSSMKEIIIWVRNMEKAPLDGLTNHFIQVTLKITKLKVLEFINGVMEEDMKDNGLTTKCMVKVFLHGLMGGDTMVNTLKTKNKVKESFIGQMEGLTKEVGLMESNMALANTPHHRVKPEWVNGLMERE